MICQSLSSLKVRGSDGSIREIPPGEIFYPAYPEKIQPLVERGKVRIIGNQKLISEERQQSLDACMTATILAFRDEIIKGGRWRPSPTTHATEQEIEHLQREIMSGRGKLLDFKAAVEKWKAAGTRER